ncbi:unnamed protein product [Darwinula stevensoni]|uniref:Uncharacterized protein n=1 Tax=Darwinula stevensoni TaxID=69355 RepID=A0A7R8XCY5_9CRUS|nr:unnamed protein product [Darwinula stevensoni]CAG0889282.1 unnamed protein product [Darwinula stevensoni]
MQRKHCGAVYTFLQQAIGEPPLFLSASIFFAVKEAIASARQERNLSRIFKLDSPATAERIRMACQDNFTDKVCCSYGVFTPLPNLHLFPYHRPVHLLSIWFEEEEPGTFKPWSIQV